MVETITAQELQKNFVEKYYIDLEFDSNTDDYKCTDCNKVTILRYVSNCGHYFCQNCRNILCDGVEGRKCRSCTKCITKMDAFEDLQYQKKFLELKVSCPFKKQSCKFYGTSRVVWDHVKKCKKYKDMALSVAYKESLEMQNLEIQNLELQTEKPAEKLSEIETKMTSLTNRTNSKIKCWLTVIGIISIVFILMLIIAILTYFNGMEIKRVNEKFANFEREMETKYTKLVVEMENLLKTQNQFKDIDLFNNLTLESEEQTDFQFKTQMTNFNLCKKKIHFQPDFIWKINGITELLKQKTFEVKSEVFTWNEYPVKAKVQLELKQDDGVYVSLNLIEDNVKKAIDIKLIPTVYYLLRDQTNNTQTKHKCLSKSYQFISNFLYSLEYESFIAHKSWFTDKVYNVNDSFVMEIYLEPRQMAHEVYSYDGTLNWLIDNYRERKQMEQDKLVWGQESPYFYTDSRGYRVRVNVHLNGLGEYIGKGLTVSVVFLPGEFYHEFRVSFPHQTTITLRNRKYPERSITKRVNQNIKEDREYYIDMCSGEVVNWLLNDDTLFYKVNIQPI